MDRKTSIPQRLKAFFSREEIFFATLLLILMVYAFFRTDHHYTKLFQDIKGKPLNRAPLTVPTTPDT
jgi:hypothetical protein